MKATTFKLRLKSAKESVKAQSRDGRQRNLTRKWSEENVKAMKKALEGGQAHTKSSIVRASVSPTSAR
jgi:hypothetical protein